MNLPMTAQEAPARLLRLLVINPNTNPAVTRHVQRVAEELVGPDTRVTVVNPQEGPFSIETAADKAAALPRALDLIRRHRAVGYHALAFACFEDLGLAEARAVAGMPVVGACEAGIAAARTVASRFSIVTTVAAAVPTIKNMVHGLGAGSFCGVVAAGIGVAAAAGAAALADARIAAAIRLAIEEQGAQAIILGSGGLTGRAAGLQRQFGLPVIDGVAAAIKMAEAVAALGLLPD